MNYIDFRSDTVTLPTKEMLESVLNAQLGDDVYEEDLEIIELEKIAAKKIGKEKALFVPTGCMGNLICLLSQTNAGDNIILSPNSHIAYHERGSYSRIAGLYATQSNTENYFTLNDIKDLISDGTNIHSTKTTLIAIENAYSLGNVMSIKEMEEIYSFAKEKNIKVHLDGARIFNAANYLNVEAKKIASFSDSVMFCLSKGLGAPVGSIIAGTKEFIEIAKGNRKLLGGGMRQAGVLASMGKIALEKGVNNIVEDHKNAIYLKNELSKIPEISITKKVEINMIFFQLENSRQDNNIIEFMLNKGIKINPSDKGEYRIVTNKDISNENCMYFIEVLKKYLAR